MGGTIQFILRDVDGSVHKRLTWTNSMLLFCANSKIFQKDRSFVDKEVLDYKNIYDTPQSRNRIAPYSYGIIVLDWKLNKLYSCNGYSDYGILYSFDLLAYGGTEKDNIIGNLVSQKRIVSACKFSPKNDATKDFNDLIDFKGNTLSEIKKKLENIKDFASLQIRLDLSPLKVVCFQESRSGFRALKKMMIEDEFVLDKGWSSFTK